MRAVVTRVHSASVRVGERLVGAIGRGLLVLLGVAVDDGDADSGWMAEKVVNLRIFCDHDGRMNRSIAEVGGAVLLVSQFTLYGDARKGRRPSFIAAAKGPLAERLYTRTGEGIRALGIRVGHGEFGADMQVESVNDGPVTILLDSKGTF